MYTHKAVYTVLSYIVYNHATKLEDLDPGGEY
jgi:hypothetical protein